MIGKFGLAGPVPHSSWEGRVDNKIDKLAVVVLSFGTPAMHEERTTVFIQRYLDALPGDTSAEPAACACCVPHSCTRAARG